MTTKARQTVQVDQKPDWAQIINPRDNWVLHLDNWPGSQSERMWQNVYHNPPIENVTIKFRIPSGKQIRRISLFVPGDYSQKKEQDILFITLLEIKNYQGVLIEIV